MSARDDATARQVRAADPAASTWLSANAGSGKTRVLTDRVARLLLAGTDPQKILCLTYTKAAAGEMQNRLFARLGEWAMLGEDALRAALAGLGEAPAAGPARLAEARRLFARAIETPGGLKIQTIHAFCAGLLRRFPLEAGVTPNFAEMDDRTAAQLRADMVEEMAAGEGREALDAVAALLSGEDLAGLTAELARNREAFAAPLDRPSAFALFGLPADYSEPALLAETFAPGDAALLSRLCRGLAESPSKTDGDAAARLAAVEFAPPGRALLDTLIGVFLTGSAARAPFAARIGSFPTKAARGALGADLAPLEGLMARVEAARPRRNALIAAERALALHGFAARFLPAYAAAKAARGWLDFDDQVLGARDLLSRRATADWVRYRLDGDIDHILVDEAQDTNPAQWQVIAALAQEFTAGAGAHDGGRTIFAVGDVKQSIYSFQGADPSGFERMAESFDARLADAGAGLQRLTLEHSFRSAAAILGAVDATFPEDARAGLADAMTHRAIRAEMPGRVDLWPALAPAPKVEDGDWTDPVDAPRPGDPAVELAGQIAAELRSMIDRGETIEEEGVRRPLRAGDVLILVRRRSDLFHEIIRACRAAGLDVAGADRLRLAGELAVRDLTALLAFLALPEDDLSLAAALRSPLFGWGETALHDLAAGRGRRVLWAELRRREAEFPGTLAVLGALRDAADYLRPYDLIERALTRHDFRRRLTARLGEEVEDGIDALLSQALAYERMEVPSLTGFLAWLESGEVEMKRQPDAAGDRLRVMTVHAAKGLEAPVVILPDTAKRPLRQRGEVLMTPAGPAWRTRAEESPPEMAEAVSAAKGRAAEEDSRLLYVAMTRAEQWLVTAAAGDAGTAGESWHGRIAAGLGRAGGEAREMPTGQGLRLESGAWPAPAGAGPGGGAAASTALPAWTQHPARTAARDRAPLSPSDLGGAKALPGEAGGAGGGEAAALRRGRQVHLLLEHLAGVPEGDRARLGRGLLAASGDPPAEAELPGLLTEAAGVLDAPGLAFLFAPGTLAEVPVTAALDALGGQRIRGTIDRLVVFPDRVLAADFKSNTAVPGAPEDVPEGLLRQMGAYSAALALIYPERRVETALVWTRAARLMILPQAAVTAALAAAPPP